MAKESMKAREVKRAKLVEKYAAKRAKLKEEGDYVGLSLLPKNSSRVRLHNRCKLTGRPRGYMRQDEIKALLKGATIASVKRTCDLVMFTFRLPDGRDIYLHLTCFLLILYHNMRLACSNDMFVKGDQCRKRRFKWDSPGDSLFDESLAKEESKWKGKRVTLFDMYDGTLRIVLEDNLRIFVIPDSAKEKEFYRLFSSEVDYLIL